MADLDAHAEAVLDRLKAVVTAPRKVHDGVVPAGVDVKANPYVLARFSEAPPELNFQGVTHLYVVRITLHCVGGNDKAARQMAALVFTALQDFTPSVAARTCFPIRWEDSAEQPPSESTGITVASQVRVFLLRSIPAF